MQQYQRSHVLDMRTPHLARAAHPVEFGPSRCRFALGRLVPVLAALGIAVLTAFVTVPAGLAQEAHVPAGGQRSTRSRILDLFSRLHSPDAAEAAEAEELLRRLGMDDLELQTGRKLVHPDPGVRVQLVQWLAASHDSAREDLLLELTRDDSSRVRAAVLEAVGDAAHGTRLEARIRELAAQDEDAIVRGRARLLVADWQRHGADPLIRPLTSDSFSGGPSGAVSVQPGASSTLPMRRPSEAGLRPREMQPQRPAASLLKPVRPYWMPPPPGTDPSHASHTFDAFYVEPSLVEPASYSDAAVVLGEIEPFGPGGPFDGPARLRPEILERPLESPFEDDPPSFVVELEPMFMTPIEATLGYAGPSSVLPTEVQTSPHFVPVEDRWRIGFPAWDRYGRGHPWLDDYPYVEGHWWDPYNQNVLKGDYPVIGQNTFMNITLSSLNIFEFREVPTATTPFESTFQPFQENFFGDPRQFQTQHFMSARFDVFRGNTAAFKPVDWQVRVNPVYNINHLRVHELGQVSPDVRRGRTRTRDYLSLNEWFVEAKLADLGPDYDFASMRIGNQFFNSDFRGFVFVDTNRAVRLFGTQFGNRDQFNIIFFDQVEKETNSELNTFEDRHQNTFIANYYRQDFFIPGYNAQVSYHFNDDGPSVEFDRNRFLVRPDPAGNARSHRVRAHYLGATGDGHIGRINVSNAFYYVLGRDDHNPIGKRRQDIRARMGALELSIDRDWIRFRTSVFHASGDRDPFDGKARGFDAIFDNPNFAGGDFTYWQRNAVRLFGVNLTNRQSPIPNLRSSRIQGQTNFVNPGLNLVNAGMDFEVTPKLKLISNANYLWFDSTAVLEQFTFQDNISSRIGADLSLGIEYRPFLNDNFIIQSGLAALITGRGFDDLYAIADPLDFMETRRLRAPSTLYSHFLQVLLQF